VVLAFCAYLVILIRRTRPENTPSPIG